MTKFDWCREFFDSREDALRAKSRYDKQGYKTSNVEPIHEVDEKIGAITITYELLVSYDGEKK